MLDKYLYCRVTNATQLADCKFLVSLLGGFAQYWEQSYVKLEG